jgi:hypothetical protein
MQTEHGCWKGEATLWLLVCSNIECHSRRKPDGNTKVIAYYYCLVGAVYCDNIQQPWRYCYLELETMHWNIQRIVFSCSVQFAHEHD